jgi:hypothetical protein
MTNRKVAIFSVGRSGSKALQLYIGTGLAKEYGTVRVNYEPFMYAEKSLRKTCSYGKYLDKNIPKFTKKGLNKVEKTHLDNFVAGMNSDYATVSKFIRAGGRSGQIVRRLDADVVFLLIRDVYEVMESIARRTWNLVEGWERLCSEASGEYPSIEPYLEPSTDKLLRSSIHWFIMNNRMINDLNEADCDVRLVRYKDLDKLGKICLSSDLPTPPVDLDRRLLRGGRIHGETPLTSVHVGKSSSDRIRALIPGRIWRRVPALAPRYTGSLCQLNRQVSSDSIGSESGRKGPSLDLTVRQHSLLDTFHRKTSEKMAQTFGTSLDDTVAGWG